MLVCLRYTDLEKKAYARRINVEECAQILGLLLSTVSAFRSLDFSNELMEPKSAEWPLFGAEGVVSEWGNGGGGGGVDATEDGIEDVADEAAIGTDIVL